MPRGYCAHVAFASAPALNALTSPLDGTPWPVFQNVRVDTAPPAFAGFVAFMPHATCGRMVSGSLHFPSRVLCSFHSRYYCAIGLRTCLGLEHGAPHSHAISNACYSEDPPSSFPLPLQGYHPLWRSVPGDFRFGVRMDAGSQLHISTELLQRIRIALFPLRSPLLRESR